MASSIKLNNDLYIDTQGIHADVVKGTWSGTSSTASLTVVVQPVTLTKGLWLMVCSVPVCSVTGFTLQLYSTSSSATDIANCYKVISGNYDKFVAIFNVTGSSTSVDFTYTDRADVKFIRLSA